MFYILQKCYDHNYDFCDDFVMIAVIFIRIREHSFNVAILG